MNYNKESRGNSRNTNSNNDNRGIDKRGNNRIDKHDESGDNKERLGFYTDSQGERCIGIKEFDINKMHPLDSNDIKNAVKIVCIGRPGSGKSTIVKSILFHKAHVCPVGQFFCGTEDSSHFYSSNCTTITT